VYSPPEWRLFYVGFLHLTPVAVLNHSIRVYWIEEWPEGPEPPADSASLAAHRRLADALLFGLRWPAHAAHHYRVYLAVEERDVGALANYGIALASDNEVGQATDVLRRAVSLDGRNARARLLLGQLLAGQGQSEAAAREFQIAAMLQPDLREARDWLQRLGRSSSPPGAIAQ
jgi:Tfp pilus assembly protein PilF